MRWLRGAATLAATTTLVMGLAAPAFAAPPTVGGTVDESDVIDCGGETIRKDQHGWYGLINSVDHVTKYHIAIVYTNEDGNVWRYMDTGLIRSFEVDGEPHLSLSGRSVNVGPEGTGWVGRWVSNGGESRTGNAQGDIDQAACESLAG